MYLDHRVTVKIARILNMIDLSALLLDNSGSVILPEGDPRVLNLPEAIRTNPTMPLVYGGFTLIGIPMQANRCVLYFYFQDLEAEAALQMMNDGLDSEEDMLTEVGRHSIALLKVMHPDETFEELQEYARAIEDTFQTETGKSVLVGISEPREDLINIPEAFEEARNAINIGRIYHSGRTVFAYRNLLLERFLNEVAPDMSAQYNAMIFNRKTARLFNEEMVHTIETFFDNSLNLSETARKLYIHRNTLVYRLEKVQRAIGLDLRNFDDAVTFKMMMLLGKNTVSRKFRL